MVLPVNGETGPPSVVEREVRLAAGAVAGAQAARPGTRGGRAQLGHVLLGETQPAVRADAVPQGSSSDRARHGRSGVRASAQHSVAFLIPQTP